MDFSEIPLRNQNPTQTLLVVVVVDGALIRVTTCSPSNQTCWPSSPCSTPVDSTAAAVRKPPGREPKQTPEPDASASGLRGFAAEKSQAQPPTCQPTLIRETAKSPRTDAKTKRNSAAVLCRKPENAGFHSDAVFATCNACALRSVRAAGRGSVSDLNAAKAAKYVSSGQ